jgi:hypothetical protein
MLSLTPRIGWLGLLLVIATEGAAQSPFTAAPDNRAPGTFRFAILPDRTGSNRPGFYESALTKLNLLQPEFVLCTGDLIDGYTTDPKVLAAQWDEFDALVNRLQMRFHYVAGNHDISNPVMAEAWRQRHGAPWSSFVYQDVLFLCLHSEDRPFGGLGAEQIAWAKQAITANAGVRWTMVFLHRPLWREANQAGFEQIRAALQGRKFTVFASHYHNYLKSSVDGMDAYVLATAGGGSPLRGVEVGELDHVMWVTMKPDGPVVANLALDGILPDDLVTEATHPLVSALRDGHWLKIHPLVHSGPDLARLTLRVDLVNRTDAPLHVNGSLTPAAGVTFSPATINEVVPRHQTKVLSVDVAAAGPLTIHAVNEAQPRLTLNGSYLIGSRTVTQPASAPLRLDWNRAAPRAAAPIVLDGDLREWPAALFTTVAHPMAITEDWDWHGPDDGTFRFAVQLRDGRVFVAIETTDERVISSDNPDDLQDRLLVVLRAGANTMKAEGVAGTASDRVVVRAKPTGLVGEFSLPLPAGERSFHLNVGWVDHDRPENTKPSVLWWRDPAVTEFGGFTVAP